MEEFFDKELARMHLCSKFRLWLEGLDPCVPALYLLGFSGAVVTHDDALSLWVTPAQVNPEAAISEVSQSDAQVEQ